MPAEPQHARVEHVDGEARLRALVPAWRRLALEAAEPNKLVEPEMALAAWRHLEGGRSVDWLFVWQGGEGAADDRLIGVFALAQRPARPDLPFAVTEVWRHALGYLGTPLVHRHHVEEAVSVVLDWLAARRGGRRFLRLRQLGAEGPVFAAFRDRLTARGCPFAAFEVHARAVLKSGAEGEAYLRGSLGRKRLKEYRRLRKRLGDKGTIGFEILREAEEIAAAAEEFLALEKNGWKGRRGTALAQDPGSLAYFREAMAGLAAGKGVRLVRLGVDARALAVAILLVAGDTGWLYKIAHDESFARYSPGVLLVVELTRKLLDEGEFRTVDSCADPGHPMIEHIWRESIGITDLIAVMRPGILPAAMVFTAVRAARASRAAAKKLLAPLRR